MGKSLIIVESAAKTRTISSFLGSDFACEASMGHVRDLPDSSLGVDVEDGFKPTYQALKDKGDVLRKLREAAKKADQVFLATDPDREGEAIAWHLAEALKLKNPIRIEFNEITRTAVEEALSHPRTIDMDRVNAQQVRRILDRLVGYRLSPLLQRKLKPARSAGRVQSVAVRLIVEREREIRAFEAVEYWRITAELSPADRPAEKFLARLDRLAGQKIEIGDIGDEETATRLTEELRVADYAVADIATRQSTRRPLPPFITSTLQRDASNKLGFRARRTMSAAQRLYEGIALGSGETHGLITYMRTDSTRVATEAQDEARAYINETWGKAYVGPGQRGKTAKGAQEAHECVRPTSVLLHPDDLEAALPGDQHRDECRLYRLIWTRFVASQMAAAKLETQIVDISAGEHLFRASGTQILFPGYMELTGLPRPKAQAKSEDENDDDEDKPDDDYGTLLPAMAVADPLRLHALDPSQHFTQPPPRYTEASLVKALEERGIGRPSTYAPILSTIVDRGYVIAEQRKLLPTKLGEVVTDALVDHFPRIMDIDFTATLESELDDVESGEADWVALLSAFYGPFEEALKAAGESMGRIRVEVETPCPKCGATMLLRSSRHGQFYGCSNYPECDGTVQLDSQGQPVSETAEKTDHDCPLCGAKLEKVPGRWGAYLRCERHPECEGRMRLDRQGNPVAPSEKVETGIACEQCGGPMVLRTGRRGPFLGCGNYPKCRSIVNLTDEIREQLTEQGVDIPEGKPSGGSGFEPIATPLTCEKCESPLTLRMGRWGPFLGCSAYPKCKNIVKLDETNRARLAEAGIEIPERPPSTGGKKQSGKKGE